MNTEEIREIIRKKYDTFVRFHIHRVFKCGTRCNRFWAAQNLWKRTDGTRACPICGGDVEDVTFTLEGQVWRAFVRPDLEVG